MLEVAQAALAAPAPPHPPHAPDLFLDGLATQFTKGYAAGVPMLQQAVSTFRSRDVSGEEALRWLWLAGEAAVVVWDDESWDALTARHLQLAREAGALSVLPVALTLRIGAHTLTGKLLAAAQLIEEARTLTEVLGSYLPPYGPLILAAWRGREAEASKLIEETLREVASRGEGQGVAAAQWARAVLYNGLGRYEEALAAARLARRELLATGATVRKRTVDAAGELTPPGGADRPPRC